MLRRTLLGLGLLVLGTGCGSMVEDPSQDDPFAPANRPSTIACGVLGGAEGGQIWGWAQVVDQPPTEVRIVIDGVPTITTIAYEYREDLVEKGLHPTGAAGFTVDLYEEVEGGTVPMELAPGTMVQAFVDTIGLELTHSPLVVGDGETPVTPPSTGGGTAPPKGWCQADSWTFYDG